MTKRYDEYKESGIACQKTIPKHWSVSKLKNLTNKIVDGAHFTPTYVEEGIPFLRVTDITKRFDIDKTKRIPLKEHNELIKRCNPEKGDLLLSKNGTIGIPYLIDFDFEFSIFVSLCLIKTKKTIDNRYLKYIFLSNLSKEQYRLNSKETSVTNLHLDKLREFYALIPTEKEQQSIANYLDNKTSKIDSAVAELEKQKSLLIELKKSTIHQAVTKGLDLTVPMKDSGVEWIGQIPKHWSLFRLKDKISIQTGNSLNQEQKEKYSNLEIKGLEYIGSKNINLLNSKIENIEFVIPENNSMLFRKAKKGSSLLCIEGGSAGRKITRVSKEYTFVNKLANFYSYTLNNNYVYYYLQSSLFKSQFNRDMSGMIGGVSINNLKIMISMLPNKLEQDEIVAYLDKKTTQIDQSIEVIDNQIAKMKEYKKTLINDVVTGKIKVV